MKIEDWLWAMIIIIVVTIIVDFTAQWLGYI